MPLLVGYPLESLVSARTMAQNVKYTSHILIKFSFTVCCVSIFDIINSRPTQMNLAMVCYVYEHPFCRSYFQIHFMTQRLGVIATENHLNQWWHSVLTHMSHLSIILAANIIPQLKPIRASDAIWRWRSWSTLVQVMACCLTAPSHYMNQGWLIISRVLWNSSEDIIIRFEDTNQ